MLNAFPISSEGQPQSSNSVPGGVTLQSLHVLITSAYALTVPSGAPSSIAFFVHCPLQLMVLCVASLMKPDCLTQAIPGARRKRMIYAMSPEMSEMSDLPTNSARANR